MNPFETLIRQATKRLDPTDPAARQRAYEHAREVVIRALESRDPVPSAEIIARQLQTLDAAIATIEQSFETR